MELSDLILWLRSVAAGIRTPNLPNARWTLLPTAQPRRISLKSRCPYEWKLPRWQRRHYWWTGGTTKCRPFRCTAVFEQEGTFSCNTGSPFLQSPSKDPPSPPIILPLITTSKMCWRTILTWIHTGYVLVLLYKGGKSKVLLMGLISQSLNWTGPIFPVWCYVCIYEMKIHIPYELGGGDQY